MWAFFFQNKSKREKNWVPDRNWTYEILYTLVGCSNHWAVSWWAFIAFTCTEMAIHVISSTFKAHEDKKQIVSLHFTTTDNLGSFSKLTSEIWFPIALSAFSDSDSFKCISRNFRVEVSKFWWNQRSIGYTDAVAKNITYTHILHWLVAYGSLDFPLHC